MKTIRASLTLSFSVDDGKERTLRERRISAGTVLLHILFSLALSAAIVLQRRIDFTGRATDLFPLNRIAPWGFAQLRIMLLLSLGVFCVLPLIKKCVRVAGDWLFSHGGRKIDGRALFPVALVSFLLVWGLFWLTVFPGTGTNDTRYILDKPISYSVQHPFFSNMLLAGLYNVGKALFGTPEGGLAVYSASQCLLCALAAAYMVTWLGRRMPRLVTCLVWLVFLLSPIHANLAINAVKDTLFCYALLLLIPLLYALWETDGGALASKKTAIPLCALAVAVSLLRNNGIFVMAALCLMLLLLFRRHAKRILALTLVMVALPAAADAAAMRWIVKRDKLFVESMAVPLQQIAMVVADNGQITPEQATIIDTIMPLEEIAARYAPCTVDSLKWGTGGQLMNKTWLQNNKGLFLKTWAQMLPPNLMLYINAYLPLTYTYWAIGEPSSAQAFYYQFYNVEDFSVQVQHIRLLPEKVETALRSFYTKTTKAPSIGSMIWVILFLCLLVLTSRQKKRFIVFVPVLAVWLTLMVSAPIANAFRYGYSLYLCLPFLACVALCPTKSEPEDKPAAL